MLAECGRIDSLRTKEDNVYMGYLNTGKMIQICLQCEGYQETTPTLLSFW